MGEDLKGQKLEQLVWQQKVEELFRQVPLSDILARSISINCRAA